MKKNIELVILSLAMMSVCSSCGCANSGGSSITREEESSSEPTSTPTSGTGEETSEQKEPEVSDLTEAEYSKFVPNYYKKLEKLGSFEMVTKGQTVSTVLFIQVTQSIDVDVIKGKDYTYMMNESHSDMVNTTHQVYYHDSKALYKDNGEENFHLKNLNDYLNKYGTYPLDHAIEGYAVNDSTILSISKEIKDEKHVFTLSLDPEKATNNVKIQMKQFGGLDDYPSFSNITLKIELQNDYTPVSINVDAQYKAKKVMESDCHQTYDVTFSNIGDEIEIPNLNDVKALFDGEIESNN